LRKNILKIHLTHHHP